MVNNISKGGKMEMNCALEEYAVNSLPEDELTDDELEVIVNDLSDTVKWSARPSDGPKCC
jgi:hypothetical protein